MTKGVFKIMAQGTLNPLDNEILACVKLDDEYDAALQTATGLIKATENENGLRALISVGEAIKRGYLTRLRVIYRAVDGKNKVQHLHVAANKMPEAAANVLGKSLKLPGSNPVSYIGVINSASVPRRRTII